MWASDKLLAEDEAAKRLVNNTLGKSEDKSQDILDMIKYARHIHVAGEGNNIDTCKKCGHDLRHVIHWGKFK